MNEVHRIDELRSSNGMHRLHGATMEQTMSNKPWLEWCKRRVIPMPPIPTLLEMWKPGLTPARVLANRVTLLTKMQMEIDAGRERRGECLDCGKHHGESFACLSAD